MSKVRKWLVTIALVLMPTVDLHAVNAVPNTPAHPPQPVLAGYYTPETITTPGSKALQLPPLKAVLLVGPIDGDDGEWTTQEKHNMDLAAAELESSGVQVYRFYTPDNDWNQIKSAAEGAHFLLYRGHGVYWSDMPTPTVGGLALRDGIVSPDEIRNELKLAPRAIVMLYGCFTAGASSIDGGPISSAEAQRRVAEYSDPFLDNGAAGYYANWFGDAFQMYLRYLFAGMTLGEAYEAYSDFNASTVERYAHPYHPELAMWLDKDDWDYMQYNNAFSGRSDHTLEDLFSADDVSLTPEAITYVAEPSFPAQRFGLRIDSDGTQSFAWSATVSGADTSWLAVQPSHGVSGQQAAVVLTPTGKPEGVYRAEVRIAVEESGEEPTEQDMAVTLYIVDRIYRIYLPATTRMAP